MRILRITVLSLLAIGVSIALAKPAVAQTFTTLHSFNGTDGARPWALIQDTRGNLYGTTVLGGAGSNAGTVFKITTSGTLTTLHSFCSQNGCPDGQFPTARLVQATDGNFYSTTIWGGANNAGTVFKITKSGTLTTLHSFNGADGAYPAAAGLVQATDGNFYGTTNGGGANGVGTVFKITNSGMLTALYSFCSQSVCADGAYPNARLVQATDGNFYGTTSEGGANGLGTVFKITKRGKLTTLYSFCSQSGCTDGAITYEALVQATDGNFYGTTIYGGTIGVGTVFKITKSGTLTTLHSFNRADGSNPHGLIQATDGSFYGTANGGGANGVGTVFTITLSGTLTTLYSFCSQGGCPDGAYPGGVLQATDGNFYGTASGGGANGVGTVFKITPADLPRGQVIAFASTRDEGFFQIFVMKENGDKQTQLTHDLYYNARPNWSHDGQKITFTSWRPVDSSGEVYAMNADGSGQTNLSNNPANDQMSVWSPNDRKIAFVSDRDGFGFGQIYVMNADGSGQTRLSDGSGQDLYPSWSPDGRKIAFEGYRGGNYDVYVMNADGSNPINLTQNLAIDGFPAWSPRGDRIAFRSDRDGNGAIYVMSIDGSRQTRLTNNLEDEYYPAWSPTGEHIAYVGNLSGNYQIYVMNANGSAQRRVTYDDAFDTDPAWAPLRCPGGDGTNDTMFDDCIVIR